MYAVEMAMFIVFTVWIYVVIVIIHFNIHTDFTAFSQSIQRVILLYECKDVVHVRRVLGKRLWQTTILSLS